VRNDGSPTESPFSALEDVVKLLNGLVPPQLKHVRRAQTSKSRGGSLKPFLENHLFSNFAAIHPNLKLVTQPRELIPCTADGVVYSSHFRVMLITLMSSRSCRCGTVSG
jgi:hypothetical protein